MRIKEILNNDLVNLKNCESEPIHVPGSIQPHGFLLAVRPEDYVIDYCSANCEHYTGLTVQNILGKSIAHVFSDEQAKKFDLYTKQKVFDKAQPFVFHLNTIPYNTSVHKSGSLLILELEPFPDGSLDLPNLYNQTRKFVSIMEGSRQLLELCQAIAEETRGITGYDRVMIYRFDKDYNGEVVAESKREDLVSFSGQKYPHTDIPAQARELYIRNQMRMIADINYQPIPLLTLDDRDEKDNNSLDLSLSVLRSVSPIHIEYLKNMGVGATLTISVLKDQKLWGLIACHHYAPKNLPHFTRLSALLQGHFLTSQISVREVAEEFETAQKVEQALRMLLADLDENQNFIPGFFESPQLLALGNASGVIVYYRGLLYKKGLVPADSDIMDLVSWLSDHPIPEHHSISLAGLYPAAKHFAEYASGIIHHALSATDCILWLRPEVLQTINWAGNPHKPIQETEEESRLTPRKSFEQWMEVVRNKSTEWRKSELNATAGFAHALQKHINLQLVKSQEEKYRLLNEELQSANKELANLNWISTHDLKEPLRKIQIFASKVLSPRIPELPESVMDSVRRMNVAAEKMQRLIEDILSYSRAGSSEKVFVETDLNHILHDVLEELQYDIQETNAVIISADLPIILAIPFQINQLFINLIRNAIKFVVRESIPEVKIAVETVDGGDFPLNKLTPGRSYHKLTFSDQGIGFENIYQEKIFEVFQRLHPAHRYPGTGIGLAICKKIVDNHNGAIQASSRLGTGAIFTVFLPVY